MRGFAEPKCMTALGNTILELAKREKMGGFQIKLQFFSLPSSNNGGRGAQLGRNEANIKQEPMVYKHFERTLKREGSEESMVQGEVKLEKEETKVKLEPEE